MTRRDWVRCGAGGLAWHSLAGAADEVALSGAGASFPEPIYQKWFASFARRFPGKSIRYRGVGSGEGVELLQKGEIDFAASDHPLSAQDEAKMPWPVRHVPTVVGAVVPVYRLDGLMQNVRFTPEALAGIYLGRIRHWNDSILRAANHGVSLPGGEIKLVHRSGRSGTAFVWTEYLSSVSAEWNESIGAGDHVKWPLQGVAAKGSAGVVEAVASTPNSLGYVEFIYALDHRVSAGEVRNRAGKFVRAGLPAIAAAAATAATAEAGDAHVSIVNAPGDEAYPVAAFTYLIVPRQLAGEGKQGAMRELLRWILTSGQKQCAALGYAGLPDEVAAAALRLNAAE